MSAQANHSALLVEHMTERRELLIAAALYDRGVINARQACQSDRVTCDVWPDGVEVYYLDRVPLVRFGPVVLDFKHNIATASQEYKVLFQ